MIRISLQRVNGRVAMSKGDGVVTYYTDEPRQRLIELSKPDGVFDKRIVYIDGEVVGYIESITANVDRRRRGSRIVTSRHQRSEFRYYLNGHSIKGHRDGWDATSLWRTVESMIQHWERL